MKKYLKIFIPILFGLLILLFSNKVEANSINKISMDIYIDSNGTAQVTEIWNCYANNGTEIYHPYYNLGTSEIYDLKVYEGSKQYTTLSSWNTSGSLSSKAYKCGINNISNGVELCWGISDYGSHTYTVKYKISDFVSSLNDSQMIYWTLIPYEFSEPIGSVYIKIHTDFRIRDSIDVWGYGNYGGTAYVYDGYIEMQSDGKLDKSEYMTILVKFPSGTFNTYNHIDKNFDYYYKMAQKGSTPKVVNNIGNVIKGIINFIIRNFYYIIIIIIGIFAKNSSKKKDFKNSEIVFDNQNYFRDIPCKGNLFMAYYIAYQCNIIKNKTDLLGAIILKWIKDGLIRIEQREKNGLFKKEDTVIILNETNPNDITDIHEKALFKMLYEASIDGILENKEFERWCNKSYSKILSWFDEIIKVQRQELIINDLIVAETKGIFSTKVYHPSKELLNYASELAGLKKYLSEYTLIPDRQPIEVHLFEEFLVYAQMMGIAKKVASDFKELYPNIIEESQFNSYDNIIFIHTYSTRGVNAATSAQARAESYSSGGGGFSSGGGGGGSFGGGGGGGGFR